MATREPSVELFYDPAELDPHAPRLHIRKDDGVWVLRDAAGSVLSSHAKLPDAIDAAEERSRMCFCEILVRGAVTPTEWSVRLNPAMAALARVMSQPVSVERESAGARRRVSVGAFPGHHVFLPARRRFKNSPMPVELYYDPAELDPDAPRLHIRKDEGVWMLRDADGVLLSSHAKLPEAIDTAEGRSRICFCEILVRGAVSSIEWSVRLNPEMVELARVLNQPVALEREAAD